MSPSNTGPEVSVIISTYNNASQLLETIESVLNQSFTNFEIIICDDGSTDSTSDKIANLADPRIHYVKLSQNSGSPAKPMSEGVKLSKSPVIAFLDHDDLARNNWLAETLAQLNSDKNIGMAWGQHSVFIKDRDQVAIAFRNPFGTGPRFSLLPTMLSWTPGTSGLVVKKEVFNKIGLFDAQAKGIADLEFTLRFAKEGLWSVSPIPKILLDYRKHSRNLSNKISQEIVDQYCYLINKHIEIFKFYPHFLAGLYYKVAWLEAKRSKTKNSLAQLCKAISLDQTNLKYKLYKYIIAFRLFHFVQPTVEFKERIIESWRVQKSKFR